MVERRNSGHVKASKRGKKLIYFLACTGTNTSVCAALHPVSFKLKGHFAH